MKSFLNVFVVMLLACGLTVVSGNIASADPIVSIYTPANVGIGSMSYSYDALTSTITINETWTSAGSGFLEITGLNQSSNYTVIKYLTNNSGISWDRIANELLDPLGQTEDSNYDPTPYPSFVPAGFSTSNDNDGLSFAQGSGIPRTSDTWSSLLVDELSHARDFLDFYNGVLGIGNTAMLTYGLRDNNSNQPFLLSQRPNKFSTPEPATLLLLGSGLIGVGFARKRFKK